MSLLGKALCWWTKKHVTRRMRKSELAYFALNNAMATTDDKRICERCDHVVTIKTRKRKAAV